jgi:serine protease AprX
MRLQGAWKAAALLLFVAALFALPATPATGDRPPPPEPLPRIVDADGNKIFDDLQELLAPAPADRLFPVIVVLEEPLNAPTLEALRARVGRFQTTFQYPSIDGFAATLTKRQILVLASLSAVRQIEPDRIVEPTLDTSTFWFGVQKARADFGVDGNADGSSSYSSGDVVVAILDTGIDVGHVDLNGGKVIAWKDFINNHPSPYDEGASGPADCAYHGTHVSSIVAGEGEGNPAFKGVAPGAALVGVKVLGIQTIPGLGKACVGTESQVNGGIQWVIDNKDTYNIRVFNMSLGVRGCSDGTDSQSLLVDAAVDAGLVAVVSAGNSGPAPCTIGSPAAARNAISVGAMADPQNRPASVSPTAAGDCGPIPLGGFYLACFSSRGPTADGRVKPDIAAPGVFIMAAAGGTSSSYKNLSGTSMSSPFVAGIAALMIDADPSLTPAAVKSAIMSTAVDWGTAGKDTEYGAGRLDGYEAVRAAAGTAGTNITVPNHQLIWGTLEAAGQPGDTDEYTISISDPSQAIAFTIIMPTWNPDGSNELDFDAILFDKDGVEVARSESARRQETIGLASAPNGPYKLRIFAWPGSGAFPPSIGGPYFFDFSGAGSIAPPVSVALNTDGATPFGVRGFNVTVDTTVGGTNDVQTVEVTSGPADLFIKTSLFTDGENVWTLGTSSGADRVVWEFSTDGTNWTPFTGADVLVPLATGVAAGTTIDVYLRLTTPASSSSSNEHRATVIIVGVAP